MAFDKYPLIKEIIGNYLLDDEIARYSSGSLFLARQRITKTTHLIRVVALGLPDSDESLMFSHGIASHLQQLSYPSILPVLEFGYDQGYIYFVYPSIATQTLSTYIRQVGPLNLPSTKHYLDQLVNAVEYAHKNGIFHGALSTDRVFLQPDNHLIIIDFGIQQILEICFPQKIARLAFESFNSATPEQLSGLPTIVASDVYGIGSILYYMLTGYPVYSGQSPEEIAFFTFNSSIPSIRANRTDLPQEIDDIMGQALAKTPEYRFAHPKALANAFHRILVHDQTTQISYIDEGIPSSDLPPWQTTFFVPSPEVQENVYISRDEPIAPPPPPSPFSILSPYPSPRRFNRIAIFSISAFVALVLIVGITLGIVHNRFNSGMNSKATGTALFLDDGIGGHSNNITISISGLSNPPTGSFYQAWLIDTENELIRPLGNLQADKESFSFSYQSPGKNSNLLGQGNSIEITQEKGQNKAPVGPVILSGTFPSKALVHIRHLLVKFTATPGQIGLLNGLLEQTSLLSTLAYQLSSSDQNKTHCLVLSMIDIIEGTKGSHYQPPPAKCQADNIASGDGYGMLATSESTSEGYQTGGYIATASAHALLTVQQTDATTSIRSHGNQLIKELTNLDERLTTLDNLLIANLTDIISENSISSILALTNQIFTRDGGSASSAGLVQVAYAEGQHLADLPLK
jgi:serine/threonine protein kinase